MFRGSGRRRSSMCGTNPVGRGGTGGGLEGAQERLCSKGSWWILAELGGLGGTGGRGAKSKVME